MRMTALVAALCLSIMGAGPARAQLHAGEYTCSGTSGILIGLGFKMQADGTYTDLDGRSRGRVNANGSSISFVGGHLDGQTGRNVRNGRRSFEIGMISGSPNSRSVQRLDGARSPDRARRIRERRRGGSESWISQEPNPGLRMRATCSVHRSIRRAAFTYYAWII